MRAFRCILRPIRQELETPEIAKEKAEGEKGFIASYVSVPRWSLHRLHRRLTPYLSLAFCARTIVDVHPAGLPCGRVHGWRRTGARGSRRARRRRSSGHSCGFVFLPPPPICRLLCACSPSSMLPLRSWTRRTGATGKEVREEKEKSFVIEEITNKMDSSNI
jgi:hypothetical protein